MLVGGWNSDDEHVLQEMMSVCVISSPVGEMADWAQ